MTAVTNDNAGYTPFHLAIGSEVLIEIEALELRIKCTLVGLETNRYIIIRLSDRDLVGNFRSEHIKSGQLLVRYMYQGAVYGFRAELLKYPAKLVAGSVGTPQNNAAATHTSSGWAWYWW